MSSVLFIVSFVMLIAACYLYASKDNSAYEGVANIYRAMQAEIKTLHEANQKLISTANVLISDKSKQIEELSKRVDEMEKRPTLIQVEALPVRLEPGQQNKLRKTR